jgi:hypothetical protein
VLLAHAASAEHSFKPHRRTRGGAPHDRLSARSTHTVAAGSPAESGSRRGGARCRRFAARQHLQHLRFRTLTRRRSPPRPPALCASTSSTSLGSALSRSARGGRRGRGDLRLQPPREEEGAAVGERRGGGGVFIVLTRAHRAAASRAETKRRKFSFLGGLVLRALKSVRARL